MVAMFRSRQHLVIVSLLVVVTTLVYLTIMMYILGHGCLKTDEESIEEVLHTLKTSSSVGVKRTGLRPLSADTHSFILGNISDKNKHVVSIPNPLMPARSKNSNDDQNNKMNSLHRINIRKNKTRLLGTFDNEFFTTDISKSFKSLRKTYEPPKVNMMKYNCTSISRMRLKNPIGRGVSKQAFIADIDGVRVAVKMVTRHIQGVKECLDKYKPHDEKTHRHTEYDEEGSEDLESQRRKSNLDKITTRLNNENFEHGLFKKLNSKKDEEYRKAESKKCYIPPTAKFLKEILVSMEISHPNIAPILGFCVRNDETDSTDMSQHGVVAVYELGSRFYIDRLQILPWQQRLHHALELADLLCYLQTSPLGSLIVPDMKEGHLVTVKGKLMLIDLDDLTNLEPECDITGQRADNKCQLDTECIGNICEGFNARKNLENFNRLLFKRLLYPVTFPEQVTRRIGQLNARLDSLTVTAGELREELKELVDLLGAEFKNNDLNDL